jgi:hypothetical protein
MNNTVEAVSSGRILIPGINDTVAPVTEDERSSYDPIDFDLVM